MNNEERFWAHVQAQLSSRVAINPTDSQAASPTGELLHRLYIVDASNRFMANALCSQAALREATQLGAKLQAELGIKPLEAASAMLKMASNGADTSALPDLQANALLAAMLAIGSTQTWKIANESLRQRPGHPHWALLLYRCRQNENFLRPLFVKSVGPGLMPQAKVDEWVASGLKHDLNPNNASEMSAELQRAGGPLVDPQLLSIVARLRQRPN